MALLSALVPFNHSRGPVPSHIHNPSSMSGMSECDGCQQIQANTAAFQLMSALEEASETPRVQGFMTFLTLFSAAMNQ